MKMLKNDGGQTQLSSPSCYSSSLSASLLSSLSEYSDRAKILFVIGISLLRSLWNPPIPTDLPPSSSASSPYSSFPLPQDMKLSSSHLHLFLIAIYSAVFQSFSQPQTQTANEQKEQEIQSQRQKQEQSAQSLSLDNLLQSSTPDNKSASIRFHEYLISLDSAIRGSEELSRGRRDTNQDSPRPTSLNPTTDYNNNNNINDDNATAITTTLNQTLKNETDINYENKSTTQLLISPAPLTKASLLKEASTPPPPPFDCSQLDELFPSTLPDGTKDDACVFSTGDCDLRDKYEGTQLYNQSCALPQDIISIIKRLPLGTSNRDKNLMAQSLICNAAKSFKCILVPEGKLTEDNKRETLYRCACEIDIGKKSYSEKTGKCFIPFGESITYPCNITAEEEARKDKQSNTEPTAKPSGRSWYQKRSQRERETLLCGEDLECSRKSISKRQGEDSLNDFHCYCPEGKELQVKFPSGTQCVKVERSIWKKYFRLVIGLALSIASFFIILGGILHVELSDPRPGITSRGFRRKPPKLLTPVTSINLNQLDLSVASDESKLLLSQDLPSDV